MTEMPRWAAELISPLDERMGIAFTAVAPEGARATCPVAGNTQPLGLWHGGASCVLAESLASFAAMAHARTLGKIAIGVELNASHHASVREGTIHGVSTAIRLGGSTASYDVILTDDAGARVCTARVTCFLRDEA